MRVQVSAALIENDGRLLAARRAGGPMEGCWELPGGKVEEGETAVEALKREIKEELGCDLASAWPYETVEYDYPDFHLSMECFVCSLPKGAEPCSNEGVHSELAWVSRERLLDFDWLPADQTLMQTLAYYWEEVFRDQLL